MSHSRQKIEPPPREELKRLVDEQLSDPEIARHYGVSAVTVARWVGYHGLTYRRGLKRHKVPPREELAALVDAQCSNMDIAQRYGVGASTVVRWVGKHGLTGRRTKGRPDTAQVRRVREQARRRVRLEEVPPLIPAGGGGEISPEVVAFLEQPLHVVCWWMRRSGMRLRAGWNRRCTRMDADGRE